MGGMNAFSLVIYDPFLTISSSNGQQCRVTGNTLKDTGHTTALPDIYCKTRWREIVTQVPLGIIWGYFYAFSASHVDVKLLDPKRRNLWAEIMIGRYSLGHWRKIRSQACVITIIKEMIRYVIEGQNVIFMEQLSQRPSARLGGGGGRKRGNCPNDFDLPMHEARAGYLEAWWLCPKSGKAAPLAPWALLFRLRRLQRLLTGPWECLSYLVTFHNGIFFPWKVIGLGQLVNIFWPHLFVKREMKDGILGLSQGPWEPLGLGCSWCYCELER